MVQRAVWLASASARRRQLLARFLKGHQVWLANAGLFEEEDPAVQGTPVDEMVTTIALDKAKSARIEVKLGRLSRLEWKWMGETPAPEMGSPATDGGEYTLVVIVADTLVADPDDAYASLGKPDEKMAAAAMLKRLSGRRHRVWSATSLLGVKEGTWVEAATVEFDELSDEKIAELISADTWKGKAGAYDLAGPMGGYARLVEGDELAVLGFAPSAISALSDHLADGV